MTIIPVGKCATIHKYSELHDMIHDYKYQYPDQVKQDRQVN